MPSTTYYQPTALPSLPGLPLPATALQVQSLWRDVREISGGALLMYRRLERTLMRRRLEAAAAMIATGGGGGRGPQARRGGSGGGQEEDEEEGGGMDEPPEVSDFIRELGGSLAQEAGAAGGGGGLQAPRCVHPQLQCLLRLLAAHTCCTPTRSLLLTQSAIDSLAGAWPCPALLQRPVPPGRHLCLRRRQRGSTGPQLGRRHRCAAVQCCAGQGRAGQDSACLCAVLPCGLPPKLPVVPPHCPCLPLPGPSFCLQLTG
jgi:hypothetical protein